MFKIYFRRDDDYELPEGVKSIFGGLQESVAAIDEVDERIDAGCPDAHILTYFEIHEDRLLDELAVGSERFMHGLCQKCGSAEGYREEIQRCAACAAKEGWTL